MPPQPFTHEPHREQNLAVARLAALQHGVVTRDQLLALGVSAERITHWRNTRRLIPVHRGVYAFGFSPYVWRKHEMAAVLACGKSRSVLSHASAAMMWGIQDYPESFGDEHEMDVTVLSGLPDHPRICTHRTRSLHEVDVRTIDRVPVTSPARTLLDLAGSDLRDQLASITNNARAKGLIKPSDIASVIARYPKARGRARLTAQLEDAGFTRSKAEEKMLALIRKYSLPEPLMNTSVGGYEVDFFWSDHDLIVEVDGFAFHSSNKMFERDKVKDGNLKDAGFTVIRVTWRLVTKEPETVARWLRNAMAAKPHHPPQEREGLRGS